jgi:predicted transcriptional regulator of viral defense system
MNNTPQAPRLTRLAKALIEQLSGFQTPIVTDYQLFLLLKNLYKHKSGLYIKNDTPSVFDYRRNRKLLLKHNAIAADPDYSSAYRILSKQDLSADDITCIIDPFCYISHLSAMQRYGLTDRRPEALHLTSLSLPLFKTQAQEKMHKDYGDDILTLEPSFIFPLKRVTHPQMTRGRALSIHYTKYPGLSIPIRGSYARISTIGQTFLDMLENPEKCGGMLHVLDIWKEHARTYLDDIVPTITGAPKSIHKVRAGYILNEVLGIDSPEIQSWQIFAQRGGSRVLDPEKPFASTYSEKWMISINAG